MAQKRARSRSGNRGPAGPPAPKRRRSNRGGIVQRVVTAAVGVVGAVVGGAARAVVGGVVAGAAVAAALVMQPPQAPIAQAPQPQAQTHQVPQAPGPQAPQPNAQVVHNLPPRWVPAWHTGTYRVPRVPLVLAPKAYAPAPKPRVYKVSATRVYADNALNRQHERVGLPLFSKPIRK